MNQSSRSLNPAADSAMTAEHDLLANLLSPEPSYPWQPMAPETETYLASLEAEFDGMENDGLPAAIAAGWQAFSAQLTTQMPASETLQTAAAAVLEQIRQFQGRLPSDLLQSLATSATALARSGQPLLDQLVQCVNTILPAWNADDLAVLARPLAYSLRDGRGEILELNLRSIPATSWEALSDLERARLALSIASVALKASQSADSGRDGGLPQG